MQPSLKHHIQRTKLLFLLFFCISWYAEVSDFLFEFLLVLYRGPQYIFLLCIFPLSLVISCAETNKWTNGAMICMREKKKSLQESLQMSVWLKYNNKKIINLVQEEMGCYGIKWSLKSSSVYLLTLWGVMVVLIPITDIIFCRPQSSGLSLKIGSGGPAGLLKADYFYTLCCWIG